MRANHTEYNGNLYRHSKFVGQKQQHVVMAQVYYLFWAAVQNMRELIHQDAYFLNIDRIARVKLTKNPNIARRVSHLVVHLYQHLARIYQGDVFVTVGIISTSNVGYVPCTLS